LRAENELLEFRSSRKEEKGVKKYKRERRARRGRMKKGGVWGRKE